MCSVKYQVRLNTSNGMTEWNGRSKGVVLLHHAWKERDKW